MPNNYIPLFDLDETELMKEKINVAVQRLPRIASEILARKEAYEVHEGPEAVFKTSVIHPLFAAFAMNPAKFSVDSTCAGCGACVNNCPFGTIKLENGKPVWSGRCQMCMSCIMKCPKHAIQCGNGTRRRGRYVYPEHGTDIPPASSSEKTERTAGTAQFINGADVKLFSNPGVISRQLLTPANSQNARITLTEVHLRPGAEQGRHVHAHSEQTWYALRGTGSLLLADGAEKVFTAGDVVRFPENTVHGLKNTGDTEFVYVSVTCPPADFSGAYEDRS
jgi:quercetin dioxygenase-like cupin family protein/NAD-dependent dihydropyrimidine dehydrogenase PreA subunit